MARRKYSSDETNHKLRTGYLQTCLFSVSLLLSAALIFSIQPMLSKMVLPVLGGAPLVWNTVIVFFQGALLAGYLYAFLSIRFLTVKGQAILHLLLLVAALYFLPVAVSEAWGEPSPGSPQLWLLSSLLAFVTVPFVVLSGTSTIFQNWYAHLGGRNSTDPYFLYVASNTGSLFALLSYPVLIEPQLELGGQSRDWMVMYVALIAGSALCAACLGRRWWQGGPVVARSNAAGTEKTARRPGWATRLRWVGLALVPSILLLAVTLHISTNIAAVPFLWVAPLAVYLLTFIVAFSRRTFFPPAIALELQAGALILLLFRPENYWLAVSIQLAALFFCGLVCHGSLARERPAAGHLAEFYLWIAFGGWLGGLAAGLLAPVIFNSVLEYPIAIVFACLARATSVRDLRPRIGPLLTAMATLALYFLFAWGSQGSVFATLLASPLVRLAAYAMIFVGIVLCRKSPLLFALLIAVVAVNMHFAEPVNGETLLTERNFFGVHRVRLEADGHIRTLYHGTTIHGAQLTDPADETVPITYFSADGPIGQVMAAKRAGGEIGQVGVIGLGAGAVACLLKGSESITYFEIDPAVVLIAEDPRYFSFLQKCGNHPDIKVGDGRLLLAREPDAAYDVLVVDAFSSDAIPLHLLTREALELYRRKLRPHGLLAFHISNNYLDLAPVIGALARRLGLAGLTQTYDPPPSPATRGVVKSVWVALGRSEADLAIVAERGDWARLDADDGAEVWTDQYSNLFGVLARGRSLAARGAGR